MMGLFKPRIERLRSLPARQRGEFAFGKYVVEYTDPRSFYGEHKDIFEDRIYHFEAQTPAPVILDAGSCIGMSVLYFKSIYPHARITAFEPDPGMFAVLRRNLERNGASDVRLVNAGLGKEEGTASFVPDGADGGSMVAGGAAAAERVTIQVTKLSSYIDGPVDFLKMNIEGMEGDVFAEIEPKLRHVRELAFEYHCFHDLPQNLGRILELLDRQGFRYAVTDATNAKIPVPIVLPPAYRYFNLVYARRA